MKAIYFCSASLNFALPQLGWTPCSPVKAPALTNWNQPKPAPLPFTDRFHFKTTPHPDDLTLQTSRMTPRQDSKTPNPLSDVFFTRGPSPHFCHEMIKVRKVMRVMSQSSGQELLCWLNRAGQTSSWLIQFKINLWSLNVTQRSLTKSVSHTAD